MSDLVTVQRKKREELEADYLQMKEKCEFLKHSLAEYDTLIERDLLVLNYDSILDVRAKFTSQLID